MEEPLIDESPSHPGGIRLLFGTALAVFVVTVSIGILNGMDVVDFDHQTLMGHVHSGTLGWITLSVFAASLWLFGGSDESPNAARMARGLPIASVVVIVAYVVAFFSTTGVGRPITGTFALLVMVVFFAWVVGRARHVTLSVPRLGLLAALATLAVGAVLGVLIGLELTGDVDLPDGAYDAHPATMVVGFLIPVGMALAEWRLAPSLVEVVADRRGRAQIAAPFVGGVLLMVGSLLDVVPLIGLSLPLEIAGVVILVRRLWPQLHAIDWIGGGWERGAGATIIALVFDIGLLAFLIIRYQGELDDAPQRLLLALDHVMFIGVMTNSVFGRIDRFAASSRWAGADRWVLPAMNLGLAVFVAGLLADVTALKRIGAPTMGAAILLGIVVMAMRLAGPRRSPATASTG